MWSLMSFSKHLLEMGVRATGLQSFKQVILFFFGMGTMVDFLKHEEPQTERGQDWKCLYKPQLVGMRMLWAHSLGCHPDPQLCRCFTSLSLHPFEGSGYICDRNWECTHLFCCSRGSALCVGGVVSLEMSIKILSLSGREATMFTVAVNTVTSRWILRFVVTCCCSYLDTVLLSAWWSFICRFCPLFFFTDEVLPCFAYAVIIVKNVVLKTPGLRLHMLLLNGLPS